MNPKNLPRNLLLRLLTPEALQRLVTKLKPSVLRVGQVLYQPNHRIDQIYFPESSAICQLGMMQDGSTIETATVGREGASWISARIGAESMPCQTMVVVGGDAVALSIGDLGRELAENQPFSDCLTRYSHALLIHSMRLTACTGLHSAKQRTARWVLGTLDQVGGERFSITHEMMAALLGLRRPTVSVILEELTSDGALATKFRSITVADRDRLLKRSCECYGLIKDSYNQVGLNKCTAD
jgi:CRP-like cAMP-binding protein